MKFYDCQTAPSPRRVRMFIAEKQLNIETVEINLREQEQMSDSFLRINPQATVPVLELDDGTYLTTTAGCRAWLEAAHPTPTLMGNDDRERGVIADLLWRIEQEGYSAVGECLRNRSKGMKGRALTGPHDYEQIPSLAERGHLRATRFMPTLDSLLEDDTYIAGDNFSCADIDAFIFVEFAKWIKITIPDECVHLQRWHERISTRPSATL